MINRPESNTFMDFSTHVSGQGYYHPGQGGNPRIEVFNCVSKELNKHKRVPGSFLNDSLIECIYTVTVGLPCI